LEQEGKRNFEASKKSPPFLMPLGNHISEYVISAKTEAFEMVAQAPPSTHC
jgi:hypothetical protein